MKLNLGCGAKKMQGYVNIDISSSVTPDRVFDLSQPLDYEDDSIDEIVSFQMFEHLPVDKVPDVLASWYRILKPGGRLIMELPDFDVCIRWYLEEGSDLSLRWIFGSQDRMGQQHLWGWNKLRLYDALSKAGFEGVESTAPQDRVHADEGPCIRVETKKSL